MDNLPKEGDILMGTVYSDNFILKVKIDDRDIIAGLIDKNTYPASIYIKFIKKMAGRHIYVRVVNVDNEKGYIDVTCKVNNNRFL
ncbi:IFN resistance PKR/eIF-alpha inhibitor [NY_014 poxvirus]|uniref:IFN resistance PKR/eIF-alpha inhibitor n=1 Tax=NY_014 poxvirus TaxID=2025360 RepID=UPI000B9A12ED|nr:IFN resistance PKR/eIF-alpha inhibitor [NY_014 poxvirus]AST09427.1 IFN resistance PKR/eIF-alpha inhibitor [NY_014 poxvirus]